MAAGYAFSRMRAGPGEAAFAPPDWSVTVAAIEQWDTAVALTDSANLLVCANRLYGDGSGIAYAPPYLDTTRTSLDLLYRVAIEQSDTAVALTDRANRLVCANRLYGDWFGIAHAPPNLDLDRPSLERLVRAAREAWRDGTSSVDLLERESGGGSWRAETERAGRGGG